MLVCYKKNRHKVIDTTCQDSFKDATYSINHILQRLQANMVAPKIITEQENQYRNGMLSVTETCFICF